MSELPWPKSSGNISKKKAILFFIYFFGKRIRFLGKMIEDPQIIALVNKMKGDKQKDVSGVLKDIVVVSVPQKEKVPEEVKEEEKSPIPNGVKAN